MIAPPLVKGNIMRIIQLIATISILSSPVAAANEPDTSGLVRPPIPDLETPPLPAPGPLIDDGIGDAGKAPVADTVDLSIVPSPEILKDATSAIGAPDFFERDSYALRTIICPFKGTIDYDAGDISCQMLEVPENREKKRSRFIELHVVKISAKEPEDWNKEEKGEWTRRDDPVIYLTGGPGVTATTYVSRLKDHGIRTHRDLYILEQRGIGFSGDFCPIFGLVDPALLNKPTFAQALQASTDATEQCFKTAKAARVDLSGYSTIENARDVKVLREALGYDQWNVWGISYGSILGQAYLREDPDGILAAVLDAIVPLEPGAHHYRIGRHFARDLELLEALCNADAACRKAFPDFVEKLKAAIKKVADVPIEVEALDTERFPTQKAWFFHNIIGGIPFSALYEQDNYPTLPGLIDAIATMVEKEDYDWLRIVTASDGAGGQAEFIAPGMYNAIGCNDGWFRDSPAAIREDIEDHPALGLMGGTPEAAQALAKVCRAYGMTPRPQEDYTPLETDVRTLIVNGQMDPITPPPLAKRILPGFTNGDYIEVKYTGHGPTRSVECAGEFLTAFFDAPNGDLDTACFDQVEAPTFSGKLFKTDGLLKIGLVAAEEKEKAAGPAASIGLSAIVLLIGAIVYTIAPVARLINGAENPPLRSTGGARPLAWLTSIVGTTSIVGFGIAAYVTSEANQALFLIGLIGWARWFVILGLLTGVLGLGLLITTIKARRAETLPIGTLLGLIFTGFAGIGLAAFLAFWGFLPLG